jgi:hypothetical protein
MVAENIGKNLILFGVILIALGALLVVFGRLPWIGKLPGDIVIKKGGVSFYFPLATMLILSLILTILFNVLGKR